VPVEDRRQWLEKFHAVEVFGGMIHAVHRGKGAIPPDALAQVLNHFAYNLGMDFMQHPQGMMLQLQGQLSMVELQKRLLPSGHNLYALITRVQDEPLDEIDISKFLIPVEELAELVSKLRAQ
jgi:hypothetical protein